MKFALKTFYFVLIFSFFSSCCLSGIKETKFDPMSKEELDLIKYKDGDKVTFKDSSNNILEYTIKRKLTNRHNCADCCYREIYDFSSTELIATQNDSLYLFFSYQKNPEIDNIIIGNRATSTPISKNHTF